MQITEFTKIYNVIEVVEYNSNLYNKLTNGKILTKDEKKESLRLLQECTKKFCIQENIMIDDDAFLADSSSHPMISWFVLSVTNCIIKNSVPEHRQLDIFGDILISVYGALIGRFSIPEQIAEIFSGKDEV